MEWGFNYSGPREPITDPRCTTCKAGQIQECPTHAKGFALGCAHCVAAQGGPCHGHWGLEAALKACPVSEDAKNDFETVRSLILSEPTIQDAKIVMIVARGSRIGVVRELSLMVRPL